MNDDRKDDLPPAGGGAGTAGQPHAAAAEPGSGPTATQKTPAEQGPGVPGGADPMRERMAVLEAEAGNLRDQVLRAFAEMENMRKRAERERVDTLKYAVTKLARDLLPVSDNLLRAVAAVPAGAADPVLRSLLDGVTMTERNLTGVLERHGVKRMDAEGAAFNPHHHQAVMEQENAGIPAGTVVTVFEPGYMIDDRVLRPATVVVSKGGPKDLPPAEPAGASRRAPVADEPVAATASNGTERTTGK